MMNLRKFGIMNVFNMKRAAVVALIGLACLGGPDPPNPAGRLALPSSRLRQP
jgi:hypothetical protein